ncbi:MAG TPA: glycerol-3-phosphate 1-O-acyltransferase PlsY [Candidatus Polarisedimenticolaceae bacterium]|nr:glycerol-3-phosphate 1-O-acyltransferase PlsY [Candidatus Polarisedimenticolaceae bacterium]
MRLAIGLFVGAVLGSVPFAWIVHRLATGRDLRREGSGNPGAANVQRSAGTAWGLAALVLDAGKGAAAVAVAGGLAGREASIAAAAAAVVAHVFSPWLSGRGGKGVATAAGAYAVLAPAAAASALAAFAVVLLATRLLSLASVAGALVLPLAAWAAGNARATILAATLVAVLIAWRHRENFARMRRGEEPRVSWGAPKGEQR